MTLNWILFIVAAVVLLGVGAWTKQRIKNEKTNEGFLLGAKKIGPLIGAATIMATGFSGWGFIGSPGTAYAFGTIEIFANFLFAPAIVFGSLMFAGFMRKQAEKYGGMTVPEYLAVTHRGPENIRRLVHFFAGLATFVFLSVYIIGQIRAVGLVASEWLGISNTLAALLLMAVVVAFTMQGGLLAVAITDTIMCAGMLIASIVVYFTVVQDIPLIELLSSIGKFNSEFVNPTTSVPYGEGRFSVYLVFIYALLFTTTLPYMSVRFLSIKKDIKVHTMALIMAPVGIILSLVPIVGIYMYYKNPGLANPDTAMPVFLNTFLSPALGGFISLFILFAMLSTISSVLQALASALSYDMFVSVANRSSKRGDLFNRIGVLVIGVWGLFLTFLAPQGLLNQIAYIGTGGLISSFVGPIIMRAFVKADIYTCLASMAIGFLCNVLFVFKLQMGWVEAPILAGLAGTVVYLIMGYIINGGARVPKELNVNDNVGIQQ